MASLNLFGEEFNDLVAIIRPYIGRGKLHSLDQYLEYLASKGIDVTENEAILLADEARRLNEAEAERAKNYFPSSGTICTLPMPRRSSVSVSLTMRSQNCLRPSLRSHGRRGLSAVRTISFLLVT